jgi:hypothetical protein
MDGSDRPDRKRPGAAAPGVFNMNVLGGLRRLARSAANVPADLVTFGILRARVATPSRMRWKDARQEHQDDACGQEKSCLHGSPRSAPHDYDRCFLMRGSNLFERGVGDQQRNILHRSRTSAELRPAREVVVEIVPRHGVAMKWSKLGISFGVSRTKWPHKQRERHWRNTLHTFGRARLIFLENPRPFGNGCGG